MVKELIFTVDDVKDFMDTKYCFNKICINGKLRDMVKNKLISIVNKYKAYPNKGPALFLEGNYLYQVWINQHTYNKEDFPELSEFKQKCSFTPAIDMDGDQFVNEYHLDELARQLGYSKHSFENNDAGVYLEHLLKYRRNKVVLINPPA